MSIAKVKKIQLLAHTDARMELLDSLQEEGLIHIQKTDAAESDLAVPDLDVSEQDHWLYKLSQAIDYLSQWQEKTLGQKLTGQKPEVDIRTRNVTLDMDYPSLLGEVESLESQQNENLNNLREGKLELLEEKDREQNNLVAEKSKRSRMIASLKQQESKLKKEIKDKERIARELEAKIREIIEEEARKASATNIYGALTPEQELMGKDFRNNKGKLPWPVDKGIVTTGFGDNEVPGLVGSSVKNNGIDINSAPGTKVRAVFDGEVTKVFGITGANFTVLIRHGQFLSVYQNLVNVRVKTGDKVLTKEILGEAFTDQVENVAMIHFEVWQERTIMNPENWLSK